MKNSFLAKAVASSLLVIISTTGAVAQTYDCALDGKGKHRKLVPDQIRLVVETFGATVRDERMMLTSQVVVAAQIARDTSSVLSLTWRGAPVSYGPPQLNQPDLRLSFKKSNGVGRLTSPTQNGGSISANVVCARQIGGRNAN